MSIIDTALSAILKGANPDISDEDLNQQVSQLKQSGGEAVNKALSFIPGMSIVPAAMNASPDTVKSIVNSPMATDVVNGLEGKPLNSIIPNPGNPVSSIAQGLVAGALTPSDKTPPTPPSVSPTPISDDSTPPVEPVAPSIAPSTPQKAPPQPDLSAALSPSDGQDQATRDAGLAAAEARRKNAIIPGTIAGIGDAIQSGASALGVRAPMNAQDTVMEQARKNFEESKGLLEEHISNDPNSDASKTARQLVVQVAPNMAKSPGFENLSEAMIRNKLPLIDTMMKAKASEDSKQASLAASQSNRELSLGLRQDQQQDKLEQNARQAITNLRGDRSLARAEEQRDAAITAVNRINEVKGRGQTLNPIDYTDILAQVYKARSGGTPGEQILQDIRQPVGSAKFNKAWTFLTGQQAPATSKDIQNSLLDTATSMGKQADKFHEGYMKAHLIKPSGLDDSRWQPIKDTARGISFADATKQNQSSTMENPTKTINGKNYVSHNGQWYEVQ